MPTDPGSCPNRRRPERAPSPAVEVILLNLSAERCCVLARDPLEAPSTGVARLYQGSESVGATVVWIDAELAALAFDERLSEAMFNQFATAFLRSENLTIGNPYASEQDLVQLVLPTVKQRLWAKWSARSPGRQFILDLSGHQPPEDHTIDLEFI